jgi:gliding motility-associated-like protein
MQFVFTAFNVEDTYDFLYIYDGTNTSAPLIGTYTGTTSPGTITASNPSGVLTFEFTSDSSTKDSGWAATISCSATPGPPPPTLPSCTNNTPAGDTACQAVSICNLNGYCGNTSASYLPTTDWSELTTEFCGSDDNDSFLTFVASASTVNLNVWITSSVDNLGIQAMIFSAETCGSGPVTSYACWNPFDTESLVLNVPYTITASGLTPGQTYYMLIDGWAGDSCDYVIAASSGVVTHVAVTTTKNTLCLGQSATLSAIGGDGNYTWTPATGLNVSTGANVTFTPTAIGTYTITATSSDGNPNCPQSLSASQTIVVNDLPTAPAITSPVVYCQGQIATPLTATGSSLLWYSAATGGTGSATAPTPSTSTTGDTLYYVSQSLGSCEGPRAAITVTVKPGITPTFTPVAAICTGGTLTALPPVSNNGITGTWAPNLDNATTTPYTFTPTAGQCAATATLTITVNQKTIPTFTAVPAICFGDVLTALPTKSDNNINGTWSPSLNNTTTTTYTFTPATGECATTATLTITVNQKTTPTFSGFAPICYGETPPALPAISTNGISGTWLPTTISNTATDIYTFTPNAGQCALSAPLNVTVLSRFDFSISEKCIGNNFILQVDPSQNSFAANAVAYTWQNSNGATVGTNDSTFDVTAYLNSTTSVSEQLPITFSVTVLNDVCSITHSHSIDKMYCDIQKGISPNGDSKNDFFDLRLLGVKKLEIFNRYGTKVYSKANYTKEWYGQTDGGVDLPDETYFYVMELASETKTGWIYINREHK